MHGKQPAPHADVWSDWLLHHRHAGDSEYEAIVRAKIGHYADRVLDGARLAAGMTLADIGAGDGLIALRAIERFGPSLRVLLTDVSAPLLRHAEELASRRGVRDQCAFLHCAADQLEDIGDASIDAVATRAVLAYVPDKSAALREFHRVLKPGGRLSIAEPVFRDEAITACALKKMVDAERPGSQDRFLALLHRWKAEQFPDTKEKMSQSPIANYTERDLLHFVQDSGFTGIHLELHIDVLPAAFPSWEAFCGSSPHPWAPPLAVILEQRFTPEERQFFEQILRPSVEAGQSPSTERIVYLSATKPTA